MSVFKCSGCGFTKDLPDEYAGKRIKCPKCHVESLVGSSAQKPSPAPAEAKPVIKFHCPHCSQKIGVAAQHAGKKVRCTKCGQPVTIPSATQTQAQPKAAAPTPAPKPAPAVKPAATPKPQPTPPPPQEDDGELSLRFEPDSSLEDLANMEKQVRAVERIADVKQPPRLPQPNTEEEEQVSELMKAQAKAAGRPQEKEPAKPVNVPVLATTCVIGGISSLAVLAVLAILLFVPPPTRSTAGVEAFIYENFFRPTNKALMEMEADQAMAAMARAAEANEPEPTRDEGEVSEPDKPVDEPNESEEVEHRESIAPAATSEEAESQEMLEALKKAAKQAPQTSRSREVYGQELLSAREEEQKEIERYTEARQDDKVSMGAIERMSPISSGLDHAISLIYTEPSLALVKTLQCYLPDNDEFGFCLIYRPSRSGDMDQILQFFVESRGNDYVVQGAQAKKTLGGWGGAMPERATLIMNLTTSPEIIRKILSLPKWCIAAGLPALAIAAVIWIASLWVVFAKTGRMGAASLIPVYNLWSLADLSGRPAWLSLLIIASIVPLIFGGLAMYGAIAGAAVIMLIISLGVANELDKSLLFGLGLWLMPPVFYPILAARIE